VKEIEENNRMGKTRDLFKKTRDIKECRQSPEDGKGKEMEFLPELPEGIQSCQLVSDF